MEAYEYQAIDGGGRRVSGVLEADSPRQARTRLRERGLHPAAVSPVGGDKHPGWRRGVPQAELSLLTGQLAALLASGLTVEQALSAQIEEAGRPALRAVLARVKAAVSSGQSLAAAFEACDHAFPGYYCALVRAGETSGALPTVLDHLAAHLDARQQLQQQTGLALLYPLVVLVVALLVVAGLLIYVVPQIAQVFQQSRQTLPLLTRLLIGCSDFLRQAWPFVLVAIAGALIGLRLASQREPLMRRWDAAVLQMPWAGALVRGENTARLAGTLGLLVGGGVPLLAALDAAAPVLSNRVMKQALTDAAERVRQGAPLARALAHVQVFPPLLIHLVASGEASGRLDRMLAQVARLESRALQRRLAVFLALLEPGLILVMGGVVLLIVLAILLPIMDINQLAR